MKTDVIIIGSGNRGQTTNQRGQGRIKCPTFHSTRTGAIKRREPWSFVEKNHLNDPAAQESVRIACQLQEHGLVEFKMLNRHIGGQARITAFGVDVVEGTAKSPISVLIMPSQTFNISNSSNFQAGNENSQVINAGVVALIQAIDASSKPAEVKAEAKSKLRVFLEHPLVSAVAGGAIGLLS